MKKLDTRLVRSACDLAAVLARALANDIAACIICAPWARVIKGAQAWAMMIAPAVTYSSSR